MTVTANPKLNTDQIRVLRDRTGAGILECKKALQEAGNDLDKAVKILYEKGTTIAASKAGRSTQQGLIGSYVHGGRIGVIVEVNCETDFVARTDQFKALVHELCLQIAAMNPEYVSREQIPADLVPSKGAEIFYKEKVLLEQPFVKDQSKTVRDVLNEAVLAIRENIVIRRFYRVVLGDA